MNSMLQIAGGTRSLQRLVALLALAVLWGGAAEATQSRFDQARELAFSGEREAAREVLRDLLEERPEHWDARILLGRTLAWDDRYDEAREQLLIVVRAKPGYNDARNALADVELWSDHPTAAIALLDDGLARDPNNEDFLFKKARALRDLDRDGEAMITLDRLLDRNPSHERGASMFAGLRSENAKNKFSLGYGYTDVDTVSSAWHGASAQLSRRTPIGSVILRANWSRRFDRNAKQFEIDAYPRIVDGLYAYVSYGYSADRLYPNHRFGGELYANLPEGIELSAGVRHLNFDSSEVTIYTGTVAKYVGNWWISLRPYITPKSLGTSESWSLSMRRYLGDRDTYVGLTAGTGSSPSDVQDVTDLARLDSRKVGLRISWAVTDLFIVKAGAKYGWEELVRGRERNQFDFAFGLERRF
ncbi:MAG: YaiO family outer membrane beta-barrel protein [Acidobacteria bacterium]|nr:YaiO family outer membrane beta-barrel protein [Acidobacteriota bacterium]